jgi:hypothetical protein
LRGQKPRAQVFQKRCLALEKMRGAGNVNKYCIGRPWRNEWRIARAPQRKARKRGLVFFRICIFDDAQASASAHGQPSCRRRASAARSIVNRSHNAPVAFLNSLTMGSSRVNAAFPAPD